MKELVKKIGLLTVILCICTIWFSPTVFAEEQVNGIVTIDILTVNDFHGALVENGKNPGLAKLATCLKAEVAKNPAGTILVSAGDMFQGSPESNLLYGKPVVEAMNELGFAVMTIGNHEFDWGVEILKDRIAQAQFPIVTANVLDKATGKVASFVKPYTVIEKNGLKMAVIGLTTPETLYKTSPKHIDSYLFADPAETVNKLIPELKQQGADIIVVLSHLGSNYDNITGQISGEAADLAKNTSGIDAIVSAHTHLKVAGTVSQVPIVQAAYNGRAVGKITLSYSLPDKKIIAADARVVDVPTAGVAEDEAVKAILDKVQAELAPVKNVVLGRAGNELYHDRATVSVLGQWVTDIMRHSAQADVAFINGGGLRSSIPAGMITMGNLYEVMPFDNTLVTVELTGAQILKVLEHGMYNDKISMLQFSGLNVTCDPSLPAGKKIVKVTLADGSKLKLAKRYKVVINDFMAQSGDGFTMFSQGTNLIDTQVLLRDYLMDAIKTAKTITFSGDLRFKEVNVQHGKRPAA